MGKKSLNKIPEELLEAYESFPTEFNDYIRKVPSSLAQWIHNNIEQEEWLSLVGFSDECANYDEYEDENGKPLWFYNNCRLPKALIDWFESDRTIRWNSYDILISLSYKEILERLLKLLKIKV